MISNVNSRSLMQSHYFWQPEVEPRQQCNNMPTPFIVKQEIVDKVPREQHHQSDEHHIFVFCLIMMLHPVDCSSRARATIILDSVATT